MMRAMRIALATAALLAACAVQPSRDVPRVSLGGDSPLVPVFERVGNQMNVPPALLAAVSFVETRFSFAQQPAGDHSGAATGLFGLDDARLARGASLAGITDDAARHDPEASLLAGAALLQLPGARSIDDFTPALRAFGGDSFTNAVQDALVRGIDGRDDAGHAITVAARPELDTPGFGTVTQAAGYSGAVWSPAYSGNYQTASRGVGDIRFIVIHDTEGSFSSAVNWFKDPAANVSAHYVVRSNDGYMVQMVDEKNIAWHDACFNTNSVGIEHEGYASKPAQWFTEAMYVESAKLTAYLADKYNIKKEHGTGSIMGHGEAPDCSDHTDPGSGWNWAHYIDLVKTGGAPVFAADTLNVSHPASITSGELATVTVTVTNSGNAAWDLDATRVGTQGPQDRDSAFFVEGDWISANRPTAVDAKTAPKAQGTFTFQIRGPEVREPTVFDESFQLVQDGAAWFGPTFHIVVQVNPAPESSGAGGCNAGGSSGGLACMLALGALVIRRRTRR